jgi:hypothetical protein
MQLKSTDTTMLHGSFRTSANKTLKGKT